MALFSSTSCTLPGPLVEPAWLKANLKKVNLLDASFVMPDSGRNAAVEYHAYHIERARFFDIDLASDAASPLPHMLPAPEDFAAYMRELGVDSGKPIVIYDDGSYLGAARLWWMLRVFGFDNSGLLHGGLPGWRAAGYGATDKIDDPVAGRFEAGFRPELVWSIAEVIDNMATVRTLLLDARSPGRFRGEEAEPRPGMQRGHIPGALNLHYRLLTDPDSKRFPTPDKLREIFAAAGVAPQDRLAVSCGSGISACKIAFALFLLGRGDVPVYDGSWAEWGAGMGYPAMQGPGDRLQQPSEQINLSP